MPRERLVRSWFENAEAWTRAVRDGLIESRRLATDQAVVAALLETAPARVLDVGCGEGWLCRTLSARGIEAVGIDVSRPLVEAARAAGGGRFEAMAYEDLAEAASSPSITSPSAKPSPTSWSPRRWPGRSCSRRSRLVSPRITSSGRMPRAWIERPRGV